MTAHIVWDWAADCSRLEVLRRQRSCIQNCCASDWQRVFECWHNVVAWHGRRRLAGSRLPGNLGRYRTRTGGRESQSWKRHAATQEASPAGREQVKYNHIAIAWCPSRHSDLEKYFHSICLNESIFQCDSIHCECWVLLVCYISCSRVLQLFGGGGCFHNKSIFALPVVVRCRRQYSADLSFNHLLTVCWCTCCSWQHRRKLKFTDFKLLFAE